MRRFRGTALSSREATLAAQRIEVAITIYGATDRIRNRDFESVMGRRAATGFVA